MQLYVKYWEKGNRTHSSCCHVVDSVNSQRFRDDSTNASAAATAAAATVAVDFAMWPQRLVAWPTT